MPSTPCCAWPGRPATSAVLQPAAAAADRAAVAVDRLARPTAAALARDLAALAPAASGSALPRQVRLLDLPGSGLGLDAAGRLDRVVVRRAGPAGRRRWDARPTGPVAGRPVPRGPARAGRRHHRVGQVRAAADAHRRPGAAAIRPDRCSFLLVDYKGGAAFAEAAALPHTVGLVTDLDGQTTARALRSLAAELTRREAILAAHGVAGHRGPARRRRAGPAGDRRRRVRRRSPRSCPRSSRAWSPSPSAAGPSACTSCWPPSGPAGVVSPEIRANCTLRICLRTTDEADSRDVLGSADGRPPARSTCPGRALPALRQRRARRAAGRPGRRRRRPPGRRRSRRPPVDVAAPARRPPPEPAPAADVQRPRPAVPGGRPRTPAAPARRRRTGRGARRCPTALAGAALDARPAPRRVGTALGCRSGCIDRPTSRPRQPLELDLAEGGTWLAVGGPRSGRTTLLRTVLGEAVHRLGPDELHVHVLESGGGVAGRRGRRRSRTPARGAARTRSAPSGWSTGWPQEVAARAARARGADGGPSLLLLVDGVEAVSTLLDEADPARGSAEPAPAAAGRRRGRPHLRASPPTAPSRGAAGGRRPGSGWCCPSPTGPTTPWPASRRGPSPSTGRPGGRWSARRRWSASSRCPGPLARGRHRPAVAGPAAGPDRRTARRSGARRSPPPTADGARPGGRARRSPSGRAATRASRWSSICCAPAGCWSPARPGSGRSTALDAFARHCAPPAPAVLRIGVPAGADAPAPDGAGRRLAGPARTRRRCGVGGGLGGRPGVVVADDVGTPAECAGARRAPGTGRAAAGWPCWPPARPASCRLTTRGRSAALRRARTGLLLCPGPGDADLLGVRLPRTPLPVRPGRGWLVTGTGMRPRAGGPAASPPDVAAAGGRLRAGRAPDRSPAWRTRPARDPRPGRRRTARPRCRGRPRGRR